MIGARGRLAPRWRCDRHLDPDRSELLGDRSPGERGHEMLVSYVTERFSFLRENRRASRVTRWNRWYCRQFC